MICLHCEALRTKIIKSSSVRGLIENKIAIFLNDKACAKVFISGKLSSRIKSQLKNDRNLEELIQSEIDAIKADPEGALKEAIPSYFKVSFFSAIRDRNDAKHTKAERVRPSNGPFEGE